MDKTASQMQAIEHTKSSIALVAGAGAGKTMVLVEKILFLIQQGMAVNDILAITFTNKAAIEMKERLLIRLAEYAKTQTHQAQQSGRPSDSPVFPLPLNIATIDSFCSRILREFAAYAGLDPLFTMLLPLEEKILIRQIVRRTLKQINQGSHPLQPALKKLFRHYSKSQSETLLMEILNLEVNPVVSEPAFSESTAQVTTPTPYQLLAEKLMHHHWIQIQSEPTFRSHTQEIKDNLTADDSPLAGLISQLESLLDLTLTARHQAACALLDFPYDHGVAGKPPPEKTRIKTVKRALGALQKHLTPFTSPAFDPRQIPQFFQTHAAFSQLVALCKTHIDHEKQNLNVLSFNDILHQTRQLLTAHPVIQAQLQQRFQYVMVDEFQDTNQIQLDIIKCIAPQTPCLFVGDPKQSIYGFRGADVRVFNHIISQKEAGLAPTTTIQLLHNFRSHPRLLNYFNHLFTKILDNPDPQDFQVTYDQLEAGRLDDDDGSFCRVKLHTVPADKNSRVVKHAIAAATVQEIRMLTTGVTPAIELKDICILLPQMTDARYLEDALNQAHLPFRSTSGQFFRSREIRDIFILFKAVIDPQQDLNFASFLKLKWTNLSDPTLLKIYTHPDFDPHKSLFYNLQTLAIPTLSPIERQNITAVLNNLSALHNVGKNLPLHALARETLHRFRVKEWLAQTGNAEQSLANLNKLLTSISLIPPEEAWNKTNYIENLEQIVRDQTNKEAEAMVMGSENQIAIMTVHAAKGLEFPVVILPFVHKPRRHINPSVFALPIANQGSYLGFRLPAVTGKTVKDILYFHQEKHSDQMAVEEEKRLFYVALTRAKEAIRFIGVENAGDGKKRNWQYWIEQAPLKCNAIGLPDAPSAEENNDSLAGLPPLDPLLNMPNFWETVDTKSLPTNTAAQNLSVSKFVDALKCPQLYYLKHLSHQQPDLKPDEPAATSPAPLPHVVKGGGDTPLKLTRQRLDPITIGLLIHKVLELYPQVKNTARLLDQALQYFESTAAQLDSSVHRELCEFVDRLTCSKPFLSLNKAEKIAESNEVPFILVLDKIRLQGTIDRIDVYPTWVHVIDYKAAKQPQYPSQKLDDHYWQIRIYQAALSMLDATLTKKFFRGSIFYLLDATVHELPPDFSALGQITDQMRITAAQIASQSYSKCVSPVCQTCLFRQSCQENR